jgi:hypothetical protein
MYVDRYGALIIAKVSTLQTQLSSIHNYPARLTPKLYLKSTALAHAQHLLLARIHPLMSPLQVSREFTQSCPPLQVSRVDRTIRPWGYEIHIVSKDRSVFLCSSSFHFLSFFFFFFVLFVFPWRVSREEEERAFNERYQEAASSPAIAPARA